MDHIFSVDRYTKQIESYQKIIKNRKDEAVVQNIHVNNHRQNLEQAAKLVAGINQAEADFERYSQSKIELEESKKLSEANLNDLKQKVLTYKDVREKMNAVLNEELKGKTPKKCLEDLEQQLSNLASCDHEKDLESTSDEIDHQKSNIEALEQEILTLEKNYRKALRIQIISARSSIFVAKFLNLLTYI